MASIVPTKRIEQLYSRAAGESSANFIPIKREERLIGEISGSSGGSVTVDDALSTSSENPVQNKVVTTALNAKADAATVSTVSGATPTITPEDNTIYECGELTSLTISNPPEAGKYSIIFFSGATPTTTVGIENFAAEANKRYRVKVEDNYATYDAWPYTSE